MDYMDYEHRKGTLINAGYIALIVAVVIFVFRYAIFWLMPFVVAFSVAFITKPLTDDLTRGMKVSRKPVAAAVVALFYGTVGVLLGVLVVLIVVSAKNWIFDIPTIYEEKVLPELAVIYNDIIGLAASLDPGLAMEVEAVMGNLAGGVTDLVTSISTYLIGAVSQFALGIPGLFISVLFAIIGSFFIAMDYYRITGFIVGQFSPKNQEIIMATKDYVVTSLFKIVTSYATIMFITFTELSIGFKIIGMENYLMLGACIALMDVMPVLGTGGVMIPWVLIEVVTRDYRLALGLFCIYLFVTIVRNILEPKIVGNRVGLHPVLMLISMFIGGTVLGPLGIVVMPFMMIVVKNLNDSGKISVYKATKAPRASWTVDAENSGKAAEDVKRARAATDEGESNKSANIIRRANH